MSDNPSSPLLAPSTNRPASKHSSHHSGISNEETPLLSRSDSTTPYDASSAHGEGRMQSPAATSLRSLQEGRVSSKSSKDGRRWPTYTAVAILGFLVIAIILGAFFAPAAVEEYAKEALVIEPTNISIDRFTETGVIARVQANFRMDASRVKNKHVRNIGRFGTWIAREIESQNSKVEAYLPEYDNILIGTAAVPRVIVDIRNGHITPIDFLTALEPGNVEGIRQVANDWLEGRLGELRVLGKANVGLKSGLFPLGSQSISKSLVFEGNDLPAIPLYNITKLNFREVPVSTSGRRGMAVDVSLSLVNDYPIKIRVPSLAFDILVPNCGADDPYIQLADATTGVINIKPYADITVDVGGIVRDLPKSLLQTCPNSQSSPLDILLGDYIRGNDTTMFVRGSSLPDGDTPTWISQIISSVTVPVPFPGHTFDNLIKHFSLEDADISMGEENPEISGNIVVLAGLPEEMNFGINVTRVRAVADVFYKNRKLGILNLRKWQPAQSERSEPKEGHQASLKIQSKIENAPLEITDNSVLQSVLSAMLFGSGVDLKVKALVDVELTTVLGQLVIKHMPAEGLVPVKPISTGGDFSKLKPKVGELKVLSTSKTSINLEALVNFTNPSNYTAHIPYFNIHILNNGSIIGDATGKDIVVNRGNNTNVLVQATWDPITFGGDNAAKIGRELLSEYISGYNTTLTFQTHKDTFPNQPGVGEALKTFAIQIPTPRLSIPSTGGDDNEGDDEGHEPHFIQDATFHLFTSTASFTLLSPLQYSTIFIEKINATAFYNHTEPIGKIEYDLPFKVPPGSSSSPRLPVDWSFDSVGYGKIREALGGSLKLDANGIVNIRLGQWTEVVWYKGSGIGASVSF